MSHSQEELQGDQTDLTIMKDLWKCPLISNIPGPFSPCPPPRKTGLLCGQLYGQVPDYFEQAMIIIQLMDALISGLYSYSEKVS